MTTIQWHALNIGTVAGFLTPEECDGYIRFSEERRSDTMYRRRPRSAGDADPG